MQMQIRAIIFGLAILGAAWILHDTTITIDHIVVMESSNGESTTESADSYGIAEDQALDI